MVTLSEYQSDFSGWSRSLETVFPSGVPEKQIWTEPIEIINVLNCMGQEADVAAVIMPQPYYFMLGRKHKCDPRNETVVLDLDRQYTVKPLEMSFAKVDEQDTMSYFRIEIGELPALTGPGYVHGVEEYIEINGSYYDRIPWDNGELFGKPLSPDSQLEYRLSGGVILIFSKSSLYLRLREGKVDSFNPEHTQVSKDEFHSFVIDLNEKRMKHEL